MINMCYTKLDRITDSTSMFNTLQWISTQEPLPSSTVTCLKRGCLCTGRPWVIRLLGILSKGLPIITVYTSWIRLKISALTT